MELDRTYVLHAIGRTYYMRDRGMNGTHELSRFLIVPFSYLHYILVYTEAQIDDMHIYISVCCFAR